MLVARNLCTKIEEVAEDKGIEKRSIDGQVMKTLVEPCQQNQRNICLDVVSREMVKHMKETLNDNAQAINVDFRMNLSIKECIGATEMDFSLLANYPKGKGEVFKVCMQ